MRVVRTLCANAHYWASLFYRCIVYGFSKGENVRSRPDKQNIGEESSMIKNEFAPH